MEEGLPSSAEGEGEVVEAFCVGVVVQPGQKTGGGCRRTINWALLCRELETGKKELYIGSLV